MQLFQAHRAGGWRQRHAQTLARMLGQQLAQALVALASGVELLPRADGDFHGRQGSPQQQRHRNHHARRQLAFKHQQSAQPQRQGLPGDTYETGRRGDTRAAVAGMGLGGNDPLLQQAPALTQRPEHAQGLDDFGIVQCAVYIDRRLHPQPIGLPQARSRRQFSHNARPISTKANTSVSTPNQG